MFDRITRPQYLNLVTAWLGLMLGIMIVVSGTFSVFFPSISEELGWDRGQISLAFSIFLLTSTVTLPLIGRLVDLYGSRKVIVTSAFVFALAVFSLRFMVDSLWHFYAVFGLIGMVAGGTSTLPYFKVLIRSFSDRRGLALGIANSGTAVGAFSFPIIAFALNEALGWRDAYAALGVLIVALTLPIVLIGLNERYEAPAAKSATADQAMEASVTVRQAMHSRTFWIIGLAFFTASTALLAYLIHLVPLLKDRGLSTQTAAFAASAFGAAQLLGRLVAGYLLDKFNTAYVALGLWIVAAVAFLLLWSGIGGAALILCTALLGLAWGGEGDVLAYFVGRCFGLASFGGIYSILLTINLFGGVVGPFLLGKAYDVTGSYTLGLAVMFGLMLVATVMIVQVREPQPVAVTLTA